MTVNPGDTAWMLVATALVMIMTPAGLALFYGGLVQRKSVLNTVGMSYTAYCVASLTWVVAGYDIAFGASGQNLLSGNFSGLFLGNIAVDDVTGTIPTLLYVTFQGTFAAIAIAIVSGAVVERVRFSTWLIFSVLWVLLCYAPLARAVWGGGILSGSGELDFAGGTVVHINAGVSGLVVAYMLGSRNVDRETPSPSNLKLMLLGSALLWFGWFGFNAGSALEASSLAANAVLVTNVAAACGGLTWLILEFLQGKKRTLTGVASGVVAGLVGITPAAGYVSAGGAYLIGVLSGLAGYFAVIYIKDWMGYDDSLDAFGIHGVVGVVGAIATVMLANKAVNGESGAFYGDFSHVLPQLLAIGATIIFAAAASAICFKIASLITGGGRISREEEESGMDASYHGEKSITKGE